MLISTGMLANVIYVHVHVVHFMYQIIIMLVLLLLLLIKLWCLPPWIKYGVPEFVVF